MSLMSFHNRRYAGPNTLDAWVPEFWANESLMVLEEEMFLGSMVYRDFENQVQQKGDKVHTRRPNTFTARRKQDGDIITKTPLVAANVEVPLDQHIYQSFEVYDNEMAKGLEYMVDTHIRPAVSSLARRIDRVILGQTPRFLKNVVGKQGAFTGSTSQSYITALNEIMNVRNVPMEGRNLIITPQTETGILNSDWYVSAERAGNDGSVMRDALVSRAFNFDMRRSNNATNIASGNTITTGATSAAVTLAGASAITTAANSPAAANGNWVLIDGMPNIVTGGQGTTAVTLRWPLTREIPASAVVLFYTPGAINLGAGYAVGYDATLTIDGTSAAVQTGTPITFGTAGTGPIYTHVGAPSTTVLELDRPLETSLADNATVNIGPRGGYNLAFHRNAIALVSRPLQVVPDGMGARMARQEANGCSIRVTMQYNIDYQKTVIVMDMLLGVQVLDEDLGAVLMA